MLYRPTIFTRPHRPRLYNMMQPGHCDLVGPNLYLLPVRKKSFLIGKSTSDLSSLLHEFDLPPSVTKLIFRFFQILKLSDLPLRTVLEAILDDVVPYQSSYMVLC